MNNYILIFYFYDKPSLIIKIFNNGKFYNIIKNKDYGVNFLDLFKTIWNKEYQYYLIKEWNIKNLENWLNKNEIIYKTYKLNNKSNIINIRNYIKLNKNNTFFKCKLYKEK